uniref:Solute carrier family 49 member 4 n=1 Tax=Equus caballus TaxID=9796 RepID=A0A9L0T564_HORSE
MGSGWSSEEERQPLLGPALGPAPAAAWRSREAAAAALPAAAPGPGRVYGRRWLVLLLFSLLGFAQGLVWNTWGPIQNSARQAYGFSSWDIALLVLWGPIGFLPCFAFMWLLDKRGRCWLDWILVHSWRLCCWYSYGKVCRFYQGYAETNSSPPVFWGYNIIHMVHSDLFEQHHTPAFNHSDVVCLLHSLGSLLEQQYTYIF